jgi:hypothetical protein
LESVAERATCGMNVRLWLAVVSFGSFIGMPVV